MIASVELVDISGIGDSSGGVSKVTETFQEEEKSVGNMDNPLKNGKDMVGADRSNRNFNVSNPDGKDLKDVNGEKEKFGANDSEDSGGNEVSGDKSKTISGGGSQSSSGENNFFGGFSSTGGFRDGNDGFDKTGKRDSGISDGEANGCFNEFFGGGNNGQMEKLDAEGNSKGNKIYGCENHDGDSRGGSNKFFGGGNDECRDGGANGCFKEFFDGGNNGQKKKLVAEGSSKWNKIYGGENHDGDLRGGSNKFFYGGDQNKKAEFDKNEKRDGGFRDRRVNGRLGKIF
jgi:hypothetical protein